MVTELLVSLALAGPAAGADAADEASRLARRAVADELGVTEAEAIVETVEAVVWPDSGLGCAAKGEVNAAVLTRGHRVGVRVGGAAYQVHVGAGRARLCPEPSSPRGEFLGAGLKVAAAARKDLAARLGVEPGDVRLVSMKPTTWPDARLGCPGPAPAEPVATKGFVLTLEAHGKEHLYHADTERAAACED
jgi:hypothetical protein